MRLVLYVLWGGWGQRVMGSSKRVSLSYQSDAIHNQANGLTLRCLIRKGETIAPGSYSCHKEPWDHMCSLTVYDMCKLLFPLWIWLRLVICKTRWGRACRLCSGLQGNSPCVFLTVDSSLAHGQAVPVLLTPPPPPAPAPQPHDVSTCCMLPANSAPTWPARSWCSQEWLGQGSEAGRSQRQLPSPSSCSSSEFHRCQGWQWWAHQRPRSLRG